MVVEAGQVSLDDAGRWPWILGFTNKTWTSTMRAKFLRYLEHHKLFDESKVEKRDIRIFITDAEAVPKPEWIGGAVTAVPWETVRVWKDPLAQKENTGGSGKYAGTYGAYVAQPGRISYRHSSKYPADQLPKDGRTLFYVVGDQYDALSLRTLLGKRATVVYLSSTRERKFLRLFPHAREGRAAAREIARKWWDAQSSERQLACQINPGAGVHVSAMVQLPAGQLDDPELARWIRVLQLSQNEQLRNKFSEYQNYLVLSDTAQSNKECAKAIKSYPLIANRYTFTRYEIAHAVTYVNAVYAASEKE